MRITEQFYENINKYFKYRKRTYWENMIIHYNLYNVNSFLFFFLFAPSTPMRRKKKEKKENEQEKQKAEFELNQFNNLVKHV